MSGLILLATSARVAPGLLSWAAWTTLAEADEVYAASGDHAWVAALAEAGITATAPPGQTVRDRADFVTARAHSRTVVWLASAGADPELTDRLAAAAVAPSGRHAPAWTVAGSWDLPGSRLLDLVAVMDRLRSPGGCPWDAAQTHESLLPYLLEEAYETVEVIENADLAGLREELGDLLLQVVFHARLGQEHQSQPWSIDDVAEGIVNKLVSRHPHVFAGADPGDEQALELSWEALKRAEKGRTSVIDGVPLGQPALALASKLVSRAARAGLEVPAGTGGGADAPADGSARPAPSPELVGEQLLGLVAWAQAAGVDPEAALRGASRRYADRLRALEAGAAAAAQIASAP